MQLPVGAPSFRPRGSNRSGTRLLNGIDAGAIPVGGSTFMRRMPKPSRRLLANQFLPGASPGRRSTFSPRDVTDSMRGFEPRRQGATPCVETNSGKVNRTSEPGLIANEIGLGNRPGEHVLRLPPFSPCSPTEEASDLKSDKCGCESRRGECILPRKHRQRCGRFVIGRAGRKSLAWLQFLRMM